MTIVTKILERLAKNNLKTNPLKCEWAVKKTDFLGYIMTPTSVKPMPNKVKALLRLSPPKNKNQLPSFIGGINFYNSMWPRQTHVMTPLTEMTGDTYRLNGQKNASGHSTKLKQYWHQIT